MATFDANYPQNPWQNVTTKTRDWYVPDLYRIFAGQSIYNPFVNVEFNMNGLGATQMFIDEMLLPGSNTDAIGARDLWLDSTSQTNQKRTITFSQYAGKFSYHKYDNMITYWKQNGVAGLRRLIDQGMGHQITWVMEKLARNAMLSNTYATYGTTGSASSFGNIGNTDKIKTQAIRDMWLGMEERGVPYAEQSSFATPGSLFCLTTPGVIADLIDEADAAGSQGTRAYNFTDVALYSGNVRALNGEVGMYQRVRFIKSNLGILYNCGAITQQPTITAPISAGDGSPDPATTSVDGVYYVGQPGSTHYVTVSSNTGLAVNDFVTIHATRTSANGVSNGVDYTEGKLQNRRIVAISSTHISFDKPIDFDFTTDLGGGVYAYLTKGRHIHSAVFINSGSDGVVNGIMQPPLIYQPDPVDDRQAQYRFTWDAYMKMQLFNPKAFDVLFLAGSNRFKGARYVS